jgi:Cd2+/Zn2+-exporting ATPase
MTKTIFNIPGLDCPAEEKLIRNKLQKMKGIEKLEFNFIRQEMQITHSFQETTSIEESIADIGMKAIVKKENSALGNKRNISYKNWLLIAISGVLALAAEIYSYTTGQEQSYIVLAMALSAIALSGIPTIKKSLFAIRTFTLNINFLMMIAVIGAFIIGEWPEAAMVMVLFALAEFIERYSLDRVRHAIENLIKMAPNEAISKENTSDSWQIKPVSEIKLGHIILVKPGDHIPLDGVVTQGQTTVNQASITGESMPVEKKEGDILYAGTFNERGSVEFKVTALAGHTLLAKIIHKVEEAQAERALTQRFVDQFAKFYTPITVLIAILIAVLPPLILGVPFYPWIYKALVLLVIACPCALVISTPVTIVSGLAAAAKLGILIKGGVYLEIGRSLKMLALDKTGTLTQGKPEVTDIIKMDGYTETMILQIAASLDTYSEHPIAHAIVNDWNMKNPSATLLNIGQFEALPGRGVTGFINGERLYLGNHQLAEDNKVCTPTIEAQLERLEQEGKTTIILSNERKVMGILAVADTLRSSSKEAVKALHELGITTVMLTGDNVITANAIAKSIGIDQVEANMLPEEKLTAIDELLKQYKYVGMVGDGINDAPALAKSSIGFAMGNTGTDTALETADVVLMEDNLNKLPTFIELSRKTYRKLVQNISFAIAIKIVFFALALVGISTLWMAVFADMGASLIVVFNGLRLLKFKNPRLLQLTPKASDACCGHSPGEYLKPSQLTEKANDKCCDHSPVETLKPFQSIEKPADTCCDHSR